MVYPARLASDGRAIVCIFLCFVVRLSCDAHTGEPATLHVTCPYVPSKLLCIDGRLNGHAVNFVVDTGSSHHVIDKKLRHLVGATRPLGDGSAIEVCGPPRIEIRGASDCVVAQAVVADLTELRKASNVDFDVILGMPFLIDRVLAIDPKESSFTLSDSEMKGPGEMLSLSSDSLGRVRVKIQIGGVETEALVDTGSNIDLTINNELYRHLRSQNPDLLETPVVEATSQTILGSIKREKSRIKLARIGNCDVSSCEILVGHETLIGLPLLSKLSSTIDFYEGRIYIESRVSQE